MTRGSSRSAAGSEARLRGHGVTCIGLALLALAWPGPARAADPDHARAETPAAAIEGPTRALEDELELTQAGLTTLELAPPVLLALQPAPASLFAPPILAKRKRDREFDTSLGEVDPRGRKLPRKHRFRFALHAQWVKLTRTQNPTTGEFERFHFAPLMLDLGYQAQFLKYVMVRLALAAGANVANTRNAMPVSVFPQLYLGLQTKIIGLAFGYGFDWTIPPTFRATANTTNAIEQPVITRNHVVMGEVSATSYVDEVALTFGLTLGGVQSDLTHFDTYNRKFRFYLGLQFGAFFDGTRRREKKARKKAEAEGRVP